MTRRINVLTDVVANQIAAGEVVERPASIVKELVENSLDARASRIDVSLLRGGKGEIRVSDDGIGMGREDALLSLDRHATSKISSSSDLASVRTFGFRGEALPSIAAVSRLNINTREADQAAGTQVVVNAGRIDIVEDSARQRGTTVEVRNLFFNAPARAKFLKSVSVEVRIASDVLTGLALANPRVSFSLTSNKRSLLDLPAVDDAAARVSQVWGIDQGNTLILAGAKDPGLEVKGLIQRPDAAKPGRGRRYLFVNGRPFKAPELVQAAERGYRTTIPREARPWMFLYLQVSPGVVDVNVHPTKAEVRFAQDSQIEDLVERAVWSALDDQRSSATLDRELETPHLLVHEPKEGQEVRHPPSDSQMALFVAGPEIEDVAEGQLVGNPEDPRPNLWQILNTYILAETRDGILIIDQHSAHERVLFQRLMDAFEEGGRDGQKLLFPLTIRLTAPELNLIEELRGLLDRSGFEVEPFGGDTVILRAVPNPHPYFNAERAFREMIDELTHGSELVRSAKNQHEKIAMTFACKGSIKAGQQLADIEMQELFDQLFSTDLPHHDVHGRPTIIRLSAAELARKFGR
ncbi:MAG: DNA mismatch repair endonuclease MutL [Gemmatimonadetes bacterium]|nr:DNA mismatch repair endonuclease MutL [Gemmatimonadota bacterium]